MASHVCVYYLIGAGNIIFIQSHASHSDFKFFNYDLGIRFTNFCIAKLKRALLLIASQCASVQYEYPQPQSHAMFSLPKPKPNVNPATTTIMTSDTTPAAHTQAMLYFPSSPQQRLIPSNVRPTTQTGLCANLENDREKKKKFYVYVFFV